MALNILMSSANRNVLNLVKSGRLFMYKTNNTGPRIDPCGIPDVTLYQFDSFPFTATFCRLFVMNASIQLIHSFLIDILAAFISSEILLSFYRHFKYFS